MGAVEREAVILAGLGATLGTATVGPQARVEPVRLGFGVTADMLAAAVDLQALMVAVAAAAGERYKLAAPAAAAGSLSSGRNKI